MRLVAHRMLCVGMNIHILLRSFAVPLFESTEVCFAAHLPRIRPLHRAIGLTRVGCPRTQLLPS